MCIFCMECWLLCAYSCGFNFWSPVNCVCACAFSLACLHETNNLHKNIVLWVCLCFCHLLKVNVYQTVQSFFFLICATSYYIWVPYIQSKTVSKEPHIHNHRQGCRISQDFFVEYSWSGIVVLHLVYLF